MDSGHFPAFGMYLAALWKIFGKSLAVSHLAVLPFLLGTYFFVWKIGYFFLGKSAAWLLAVFTFLDPVFAGQSVLVSPDLGVMCAFSAGLYAVLLRRKILLIFAAILLAALSMRGMMIVLSLYLFDLLTAVIARDFQPNADLRARVTFLCKRALPFVPAGLLSLAFLYAHYRHTGWIGYHADSPWAASFAKVNFSGFVKNCAVLVWRILDFGRVFLLSLGAVAFWFFYPKMRQSTYPRKLLVLAALLCATVLCLTPSVLIHKGLLLHRYLLPILFALNLTALYLFLHSDFKKKKVWLLAAFIGLATGNFWVYPRNVAQGWDATLAHVPYYELRREILDFIEEENIPLADIGSAFPNISGFKYTDLAEGDGNFQKFDLTKNPYILYSNVMNDFSDAESAELADDWTKVKKAERGGVCFILYKNNRVN